MIARAWVIMQTQHSNSGDIFEKVRTVCFECYKLDSQLHSSTPTSLYVICSQMITSKFYEWLRIRCDKCNMAEHQVISLITLWCKFLYVSQKLIKLVHGFVNHIQHKNTIKFLFEFSKALSSFSLGQSPSLEAQSESVFETQTAIVLLFNGCFILLTSHTSRLRLSKSVMII